MAKRKEQPPEEGAPEWMATFSDLMNLLLCFFVLLFASSTVDEVKLQKIAASFENMSFSVLPQGAISLIKGIEVSGGVTQLPDVMSIMQELGYAQTESGNNVDREAIGKDNENSTASAEEQNTSTTESTDAMTNKELAAQMSEKGLKQSEEMYEEIRDMLEANSIEDKQIIDYNSQYVELDMNGAILFSPGDAEVNEESKVYLGKIASILVKYKNCIIEFEGHTDNVPMTSGKFKNNRYLSTARATSVYEYIMSQEKLIESNIKIAGYGETRPLLSNDTPEGRARNRRVVVKIYNQLNSSLERGDSLQ